ncbi:hypothetical protein CHA01nite_20790 [Chryseobacterium hagamense]|uniref:Uncharacterized protein n=1 Tax=Chryseobacterium hagamense TaxID=395935 RepID=A0A511YMC1_9FLAO|nr:hypothetical protein CHA01nite_20790 [Chryseobacterium hagamense]
MAGRWELKDGCFISQHIDEGLNSKSYLFFTKTVDLIRIDKINLEHKKDPEYCIQDPFVLILRMV